MCSLDYVSTKDTHRACGNEYLPALFSLLLNVSTRCSISAEKHNGCASFNYSVFNDAGTFHTARLEGGGGVLGRVSKGQLVAFSTCQHMAARQINSFRSRHHTASREAVRYLLIVTLHFHTHMLQLVSMCDICQLLKLALAAFLCSVASLQARPNTLEVVCATPRATMGRAGHFSAFGMN